MQFFRDGKFERGDDSLAIPPKQVEPAKTEEIEKIFVESIDENEKFTFASLSTNPAISVPVNGNKFFNKHIAIVGSTGSGKSHSIAKILQEAIHCKNGEYTGLNNSHIVIFDIHSEYKSAFPAANYIDISTLVLPYWMLTSDELQELFIFAQCNNFLALRLTNPNDQNYVKRLLPDTSGSLVEKMPSLKAGECILVGDAVTIPSIVHIEECDPKPSSNDIPYLDLWKTEWKELDISAIKDEWLKI